MRASCGNQGSSTLTKPEHALCHTSTLPSKSGIILRPSGSWESPRTGALRLWAAPSPVSAGSFPVTRGFRGYRYKQANSKARERHAVKPKAVKMTTTMKSGVESLLREDWSPEQSAGRLKQQGQKAISHETIYRYVLQDKHSGGDLFLHLRRHRKKYRKRYGGTGNSSGIPNRVDIEARPEVANRRGRLGDWEADTMIGKGHQGALVTLDERKSKLRLAAWACGPEDRRGGHRSHRHLARRVQGLRPHPHL